MTSVSDDVALTMDDMPLGEDGLIDFRALAVGLIETVADHAMELEATSCWARATAGTAIVREGFGR